MKTTVKLKNGVVVELETDSVAELSQLISGLGAEAAPNATEKAPTQRTVKAYAYAKSGKVVPNGRPVSKLTSAFEIIDYMKEILEAQPGGLELKKVLKALSRKFKLDLAEVNGAYVWIARVRSYLMDKNAPSGNSLSRPIRAYIDSARSNSNFTEAKIKDRKHSPWALEDLLLGATLVQKEALAGRTSSQTFFDFQELLMTVGSKTERTEASLRTVLRDLRNFILYGNGSKLINTQHFCELGGEKGTYKFGDILRHDGFIGQTGKVEELSVPKGIWGKEKKKSILTELQENILRQA